MVVAECVVFFFFLFLLGLVLQIRTHSIRKAHENIDRTLKSAEAILAHFDQYYQVRSCGGYHCSLYEVLYHFMIFITLN